MKNSLISSKKNKNKTRISIGYLEGFISIILNILLFLLKLWVGVQTFSIAIIADAWHTLSDSMTSIVVILGFWISVKPADKKHPFGHERIELISSVIIGTILGIVAFNFLVESMTRYTQQQSADFQNIAVFVFIVSVIVKEGMAQFSIHFGKKIDSIALIADGWHHRSDALVSLMILIGIFFGKYFWWIDSIMGIAVSLVIFYTTYHILKDAISPLMGEEPDEELIAKIKEIIKVHYLHDLQLHHLHLHIYGSIKELTFHIRLPGDIQLQKAHQIASVLEEEIKEQTDINATIHIEPFKHKMEEEK